MDLVKVPFHKPASGKLGLTGRLGVPKQIKPKLALGQAPMGDHKHRFAPFVQRHWKKAFVWVAIAGIGYVTVPELYYDRFYRCAGVDVPDYETCISILSQAAIEEEQEVRRVHYPMPRGAVYRYAVKNAPPKEVTDTCSFQPFVERKWNREFVWVEIPQTGNVTVPEDYYDQFHGKVGAEPPDYAAACKLLVEAAAADTVVAYHRPRHQPQQSLAALDAREPGSNPGLFACLDHGERSRVRQRKKRPLDASGRSPLAVSRALSFYFSGAGAASRRPSL